MRTYVRVLATFCLVSVGCAVEMTPEEVDSQEWALAMATAVVKVKVNAKAECTLEAVHGIFYMGFSDTCRCMERYRDCGDDECKNCDGINEVEQRCAITSYWRSSYLPAWGGCTHQAECDQFCADAIADGTCKASGCYPE